MSDNNKRLIGSIRKGQSREILKESINYVKMVGGADASGNYESSLMQRKLMCKYLNRLEGGSSSLR